MNATALTTWFVNFMRGRLSPSALALFDANRTMYDPIIEDIVTDILAAIERKKAAQAATSQPFPCDYAIPSREVMGQGVDAIVDNLIEQGVRCWLAARGTVAA